MWAGGGAQRRWKPWHETAGGLRPPSRDFQRSFPRGVAALYRTKMGNWRWPALRLSERAWLIKTNGGHPPPSETIYRGVPRDDRTGQAALFSCPFIHLLLSIRPLFCSFHRGCPLRHRGVGQHRTQWRLGVCPRGRSEHTLDRLCSHWRRRLQDDKRRLELGSLRQRHAGGGRACSGDRSDHPLNRIRGNKEIWSLQERGWWRELDGGQLRPDNGKGLLICDRSHHSGYDLCGHKWRRVQEHGTER